MATLTCFALKEEATPFRKIAAGKAASAQANISILLTGIGRRNAETSLSAFLATHSPKLVLTCGLAGGLNPALSIGDVVFETSNEALQKQLFGAGAKPARFYCAPLIATTVAEKEELRRTTGADAVEMESEIIHEICRERRIPCATVRVISDTAHENLPLNFNKLSKPDQSLDFGKLAWAIAKSPGKIPALLRLQRNTKYAAQRLALVLEKVIAKT
jgi:nucleoside phosphorylase